MLDLKKFGAAKTKKFFMKNKLDSLEFEFGIDGKMK